MFIVEIWLGTPGVFTTPKTTFATNSDSEDEEFWTPLPAYEESNTLPSIDQVESSQSSPKRPEDFQVCKRLFTAGGVDEKTEIFFKLNNLLFFKILESTIKSRLKVWKNSTNHKLIEENLFVKKIENLEANTTYYVKSYIINNNVTIYGNEIKFKIQVWWYHISKTTR